MNSLIYSNLLFLYAMVCTKAMNLSFHDEA